MKKRAYHHRKGTRRLIVGVSVLFALVMVLGSTYAWVTLADYRVNRMSSGTLTVLLEGRQEMDVLTPVYEAEKKLAVRNDSTTNAVVRVSLAEVLLNFEVDLADKTGNAHLKKLTTATPQVIDVADSRTWQVGRTYQVSAGQFLIGSERTNFSRVYLADSTHPRPEKLETGVKLQFSNRLTTTYPAPAPLVRNYWLYYDGYFYYSEILRAGKTSPILVDGVSIFPQAANELKGSFYEVTGEVEAYPASKKAITEVSGWGLSQASPVYQMLKDKVK